MIAVALVTASVGMALKMPGAWDLSELHVGIPSMHRVVYKEVYRVSAPL